MNKLLKAIKGCGQLISNYIYFSDCWFSGLKIAEDVMAYGVYSCGPVKMIQFVFLAT